MGSKAKKEKKKRKENSLNWMATPNQKLSCGPTYRQASWHDEMELSRMEFSLLNQVLIHMEVVATCLKRMEMNR